MHTVAVIAAGFGLLGACALAARLFRGTARAGIIAFIPLWLMVASVNMAVGVQTAGYSVAEEVPILIVVFAVPALGASWKLR